MTDQERKYKYHQENVKAVHEGIEHTLTNIRRGIIERHKHSDQERKYTRYILIQTRILSGLIVSWSENVIKRLFYEPNAFSNIQIEKLHGLNLQQKWEFALKVAFCNAYNVPNPHNRPLFNQINIDLQSTVPRSARDKYLHIKNLITDELIPAISIRNKVQHGEWIKAFSPPNSLEFSRDLTREVNRENVVMLQTKINQFKAIYQLIHDLAVFKAGNNIVTFERDFDKNYARIEHNRKLANGRNLQNYINDIIIRYERGLSWKEQNSN